MEYAIGRALGAFGMPFWAAFIVWLFVFAPRSEWIRRLGEPTAEDAAWRPATVDAHHRGLDDVLAVGALVLTIAALAAILVVWAQGSGVDLQSLIEKGPTDQ